MVTWKTQAKNISCGQCKCFFFSKLDIYCFLIQRSNVLGNGKSTTGDVVVPYLPPCPPRGFGYCRIALVLYKQNGKMDNWNPNSNYTSLRERNFSTRDWYIKNENHLTPVGLKFFQTTWDEAVPGIYHEILGMKEPCYEYDIPEPYREEQKVLPPEDVPFNE